MEARRKPVNYEDLKKAFTAVPSGDVTILGFGIYNVLSADLTENLPEYFPPGGDYGNAIQIIVLVYLKDEQRNSTAITVDYHDKCFALLNDCRYACAALQMTSSDFEYPVQIKGEFQSHFATYGDFCHKKILQTYMAKNGVIETVQEDKTYLIQCYRAWETPDGIYLCTAKNIILLAPRHKYYEETKLALERLFTEASMENWLTVIYGSAARFHLGERGKNGANSQNIGILAEKLSEELNIGEEQSEAMIEQLFDAGHMAKTWCEVWKISQLDHYSTCIGATNIMDLIDHVPKTNKPCILSSNPKNCLVHGRTCRTKRRQLDPTADYYHKYQLKQTSAD